jgi:hypothetical protein
VLTETCKVRKDSTTSSERGRIAQGLTIHHKSRSQ